MTIPVRQWDAPEPVEAELPIIVVSSRDGAPVPRVGACVRLEAVAAELGWKVTQTYALASMPARPRKAAHMLASVMVRMERRRRIFVGAEFGFAMWTNEDDHGWRFSHAFVNGAMVGARSIVEALK